MTHAGALPPGLVRKRQRISIYVGCSMPHFLEWSPPFSTAWDNAQMYITGCTFLGLGWTIWLRWTAMGRRTDAATVFLVYIQYCVISGSLCEGWFWLQRTGCDTEDETSEE